MFPTSSRNVWAPFMMYVIEEFEIFCKAFMFPLPPNTFTCKMFRRTNLCGKTAWYEFKKGRLCIFLVHISMHWRKRWGHECILHFFFFIVDRIRSVTRVDCVTSFICFNKINFFRLPGRKSCYVSLSKCILKYDKFLQFNIQIHSSISIREERVTI